MLCPKVRLASGGTDKKLKLCGSRLSLFGLMLPKTGAWVTAFTKILHERFVFVRAQLGFPRLEVRPSGF